MQELELNKFDPRILEKRRVSGHNPIIVVIGGRGSGKSSIMADILWHMREIPMVICMSGTEEGNGFYGNYIHELCLHNKFEKDVVATVVEKQKEVVKELKERGIDPKKCPDKGVGLIFDDLSFDKSKDNMMKNPYTRELFFNGRHFNITTIIAYQYMMDLSPDFRTNIDYVFVTKETRKDNIDRLYKYFFSIFDKPADFRKVLSQCTKDYNCLVIDNTSRSDNIEDQVFWYKAKLNREFRIAPENWDRWDKMLDKNSDKKKKPSYKSSSDLIVKRKGLEDDEDEDE